MFSYALLVLPLKNKLFTCHPIIDYTCYSLFTCHPIINYHFSHAILGQIIHAILQPMYLYNAIVYIIYLEFTHLQNKGQCVFFPIKSILVVSRGCTSILLFRTLNTVLQFKVQIMKDFYRKQIFPNITFTNGTRYSTLAFYFVQFLFIQILNSRRFIGVCWS